MVFGGGEGAELFCFSVVERGGRASVWGLVGGKVMLSGVFSCFFWRIGWNVVPLRLFLNEYKML